MNKDGRLSNSIAAGNREKDNTIPVIALSGWVTVLPPSLEMNPVAARISPTTAGPSASATVSPAAQTPVNTPARWLPCTAASAATESGSIASGNICMPA